MIFSVVLIRYYSSMAGLSPARGLAYTPAVRTQPDHAPSYHCLHATPPAHHTSTLYAVPRTTATAAAARHSAARCAAGRRVIARRATWSTSSFTSYHGQLLSLAVQWGVAIEIERAVKKSARFC